MGQDKMHYVALVRKADLLFFYLEKKEEAIQQYQHIQQLYPSMSYSYRVQAAFECVRKNYERAREIVNSGIGKLQQPSQVSVLLLLHAEICKRTGAVEKCD